MEIYLLPFENTPQRFEIELEGRAFIVQCVWNGEIPAWVVDFSDAETGEALFCGQPLVAGVDILAQHRAVTGLKGQIFIYTNGDENAAPTFENLGAESNAYLVTE